MEKSERKWSARIADGRTIGRKCAFVVGLHNDSVYEDCIASIELNHKEDAEGWFEKYSKIAECMNAHSELEAKANISDEAIKEFQKIIRNQCDEISELKAQLTWRPVSEELPEKEKQVYPKPWRNRKYNPYIVTDGHEARFAFFAEVSKDKWWFVNPHNHHEIKNVVAWKDASLGLPITPAPEGEYKMEKTGQMIEFEEETGQTLEDAKERGKIFDFYSKCIQWLETELLKASVKATAYDRLMSGGKKTLKEIANIIGKPVAIDAVNRLWWFPKKPEIGLVTWIWYDEQFGCFGEELPKNLIDYTGDWKDSLTFPDGWREK